MRPLVPITVVIPTYNREKSLNDTIKSILSGNVIPAEILVVDQTPIPTVLANELFETECRLKLIHEEVPSTTHARNVGMKLAANDIILFCDDDILIDEYTIDRLYRSMKPEDCALVTSISGGEGRKSSLKERCFDFVKTLAGRSKFWKNGGYVIKSSMLGLYSSGISSARPTEWAMGFFFCVKKGLCEKWDVFFDEKLKRYAFSEDLDFSYRYCEMAKRQNMRTVIDPSVYVLHLQSQEWRTPSAEFLFYYFANRRYLSYKIFPTKKIYRIGLEWSDFWKARRLSRQFSIDCKKILSAVKKREMELRNGDLEVIMQDIQAFKVENVK